jgi:translocator protein
MRTRRSVLGLAGWLALTYLFAWVGGQFTPGAWYEALEKPPWTPPGALFGPVWAALYTAMAVAAWLVWLRVGFHRASALPLGLYLVQLALNAAWSWIFFGLQAPGWAFAEIVVLWVAIVLTTMAFFRVRRSAGFLFLPYLAWVTFAAALNLSIWRLNA